MKLCWFTSPVPNRPFSTTVLFPYKVSFAFVWKYILRYFYKADKSAINIKCIIVPVWDTWWQISFHSLYVEKDMRMQMKIQVLQNSIQIQWKRVDWWISRLGLNVYCCCSLKLGIPSFYTYFFIHKIEEINKYSQAHRKGSKFIFE